MLDFHEKFCEINPKKLKKFKLQVAEVLKSVNLGLKDLQKITVKLIFFSFCVPLLPTLIANMLIGISKLSKNDFSWLLPRFDKELILDIKADLREILYIL